MMNRRSLLLGLGAALAAPAVVHAASLMPVRASPLFVVGKRLFVAGQWTLITPIDIKAYGAVGDGLTDDTAAFRAAMDAIAEGGTINVPEGNYFLPAFWANVPDKRFTIEGGGVAEMFNQIGPGPYSS